MSLTSMDEIAIIQEMIGLYCKTHHRAHAPLCPQCQPLFDYAVARITHCPQGAKKTFCSTCTIHCYRAGMREDIRAVMKFSGPRMLFYRPKLAVSHLINTLRHRSTP